MIIESLDQYFVCLLHRFSAKNTKNMLGGTKKALFEHSLGVGREEQPPNAIVVPLIQVLQSSYFIVLNV